MKPYEPGKIEPKWQKVWTDTKLYQAVDFDPKPKYYLLAEFPYPSGDGLHVGHVRSFTALDIMARHKRMQGFNVLYPMGWDAFGLPTENYAIKNKIAPHLATERNVDTFRRQMKSLGLSFDWSREVNTTDPKYYKWTQWIFLQLLKAGLAYQAEIAINWCPFCKTGLANEEVINGRHERCGTEVEKKLLKQWLLKITAYADRLIEDLKTVDYLPRVATQQINWIGRSEGATVKFPICHSGPEASTNHAHASAQDSESLKLSQEILNRVQDDNSYIEVFTTRADTLAGATFLVLAPEHPLVKDITTSGQKSVTESYIKTVQSETELMRQDQERPKTGVWTGAMAINPLTKEELPVWIADYVLMGYGTGAIMAVPAHDERDFEFAKKFDLPIKQVIMPIEDDTKNPPQPRYEEVVRDTVIVHLKDKSTGKFALLDWHGTLEGITTAIMGGIEDGQTPETAALNEIREEAALQDINIVRKLRWVTGARYCASHKQQNRKAITMVIMAEVDNLSQQGNIPNAESKQHTLVWVEQKAVLDRLVPDHQKFVWQQLWKETALTDEGELINSGQYDGLLGSEAKQAIVEDLFKAGSAKHAVKYKLRDWIFSRQHYWGEPIPVVHCPKCGVVPVPEDQLPLTLPEVEHYEPTKTGESPLAAITDWVNTVCPQCDGPAKRETDTMPNWAGSSWYYLRYIDPNNDQVFASTSKLQDWLMVDLYNGGMEHTTLHLLYSRFWHKFLYDQKLVPSLEPYAKRRSHGMILGPDNQKMSKSRGNVINPDGVITTHGADILRLYEMFMGPYDQEMAWSEEHLAGVGRFTYRTWDLAHKLIQNSQTKAPSQSKWERGGH